MKFVNKYKTDVVFDAGNLTDRGSGVGTTDPFVIGSLVFINIKETGGLFKKTVRGEILYPDFGTNDYTYVWRDVEPMDDECEYGSLWKTNDGTYLGGLPNGTVAVRLPAELPHGSLVEYNHKFMKEYCRGAYITADEQVVDVFTKFCFVDHIMSITSNGYITENHDYIITQPIPCLKEGDACFVLKDRPPAKDTILRPARIDVGYDYKWVPVHRAPASESCVELWVTENGVYLTDVKDNIAEIRLPDECVPGSILEFNDFIMVKKDMTGDLAMTDTEFLQSLQPFVPPAFYRSHPDMSGEMAVRAYVINKVKCEDTF